jgi:hypothetical protein
MGFQYGNARRGRAPAMPSKAHDNLKNELKNYEGVKTDINRPVDYHLTIETRPLPAWMTDPSLLPKKPPGRSA